LNIAGIGFALLAAIPGFIDFLYTVPPKSSGKKRAAQHGITNVIMLVCFIVAFFLRRNGSGDIIIALLEIIGVSLMIIAGWLGGTLVYRNQIGIDIRYANAGKWKEETFDNDSGEIEVATADEMKINAMKLLHVKHKRIVLARTEDRFVAFDDHCTHRGGSLAGGSTMCNIVQCPWHGSQFDLITGEVNSGPAREGIKIYSVRVDNGKIILLL
jgi:nitrite reductase/ring-hydroxylating ferredoxin subunit